MKYHTGLTLKKWGKMPFLDRLANIGSEVIRAIKWKKRNDEYTQLALLRSLELFDATKSTNLTNSQLKELCRLRELWCDFFVGDNQWNFSEDFFTNYFNYITVRARQV